MNPLKQDQIQSLTELRKYLHQHPELSHEESNTARVIIDFLRNHVPELKLTDGLGGSGLCFEYDSGEKGSATLFRAELDALPIQEVNDFDHQSKCEGISHKCGHDGHMAILCGLALWLHNNPPAQGKIGLLFQPAEETGEGADKVLNDKKFNIDAYDRCFALHNIPGQELGSILLKDEIFASASTGLEIILKGKTSHAGHPEHAHSPSMAMAQLMQSLPAIPSQTTPFGNAALVTIINAKLGEVAYGTTPGYGELRATLRTHTNEDMDRISERAIKHISELAELYRLDYHTSWKEPFPACYNDPEIVKFAKDAFISQELNVIKMNRPFAWSEDFGSFLQKKPGILFGLGSGKNMPQLHNPDYDFPDDLIPFGVKAFASLAKVFHN